MARVLLTGAGGRLGSAVLSALLSKGYSVRAVVRPGSRADFPPEVEKLECDLSTTPLPLQAFEGVQYAIHLAGLVGEHPYNKLVSANGFGTKHMLSSCPSSVSKIVLASSISVYGEYPLQTVDESFAPKTESAYGKSKLMAEEFAREYGSSLPIVFLRFGMIYGPGFEDGYFPVLKLIEAGKMRILGKGNNRMPLLHLSDAVQALLLALEKKTPSCREYNIVGQEKPTQQELFTLAAEALGVPEPQKHVNPLFIKSALLLRSALFAAHLSKKPSINSEHICQLTLDRAYSCARAEAELGWTPNVKLAAGVAEMVRIYKGKKTVE